MRIGLKSLLAAAVLGLSGLAAPAGAQDAQLVSYDELLERVARLEEDLAPAPEAEANGGAGCAAGCVTDCGACGACCGNGGWYLQYDNVLVKPYFTSDTAYSQEINDPGIGADDTTIQTQFDWDIQYSPRVELGHLDCEGMGWRARYWHFDHSTGINRKFGPDADVDVEVFDDPDVDIDIDDEILDVNHNLKLQVFDLEALKRDMDCEGGFTASAGIRYVNMEQSYDASEIDPEFVIDGVTVPTVVDALRSTHDLNAIGPTVAVEVLRRFNCSNWGAFVSVRGSLLYGESDHFAQDATGGGPPPLDVGDNYIDENDGDVIGVGEISLGLDYRRMTESCHEAYFRVALEAQHWVNAGSANQAVDDNSTIRPQETDMGFLGVNLAFGVDW